MSDDRTIQLLTMEVARRIDRFLAELAPAARFSICIWQCDTNEPDSHGDVAFTTNDVPNAPRVIISQLANMTGMEDPNALPSAREIN